MPTQTALSTLTADSDKGRKATDLFRHAYNKAMLDEERGQCLNENKVFPAALFRLIEEYSMPVKAPKGGRLHVVRVPVNPAANGRRQSMLPAPIRRRATMSARLATTIRPKQASCRSARLFSSTSAKLFPIASTHLPGPNSIACVRQVHDRCSPSASTSLSSTTSSRLIRWPLSL